MYKAILFDFGGVIYQHSKQVIPEVLSRIYNQPLESTSKEYRKYKSDYFNGSITSDFLISSLSMTFKSTKSIKDVKKEWVLFYSQLAHANPEVINIIKELKKKYRLCLFSNTTEMSNLYNSKTGIYDLFDDLFLSFKMRMKKPDVNIYEKVLFTIKLKSSECVFVDDSQKNLDTANQIGIKTILFNVLTDKPQQLRQKLKDYIILL